MIRGTPQRGLVWVRDRGGCRLGLGSIRVRVGTRVRVRVSYRVRARVRLGLGMRATVRVGVRGVMSQPQSLG